MKLVFTIFLFSVVTINAQWVKVLELPNNTANVISTDGSTIIVGADTSGIHRSLDNGNTWQKIKIGTTNKTVKGLYVKGNLVLAGAYDTKYGLYRSTDKGDTWTQVANNQFGVSSFISFAQVGQAIFAAASTAYGVFKSTDNGATWTQSGLVGQTITHLYSNNQILLAGINSSSTQGLMWSDDAGANWKYVFTLKAGSGYPGSSHIHNGFIYTDGDAFYTRLVNDVAGSFSKLNSTLVSSYGGAIGYASRGTALFVAIKRGVYHTTNDGISFWTWANGLPTTYSVDAFSANTDNAFVGLFKNGVWRRSLSQITSVEKSSEVIPAVFELKQNYPNPFNPETTISYKLQTASNVSLKVYDVLGNEISTLVNEYQQAGSYKSQFSINNSQLTSGIYYYTLTANGFSSTKKMIVIK